MNEPGFAQAMTAVVVLAITFLASWLLGKFTT